MVIDKVDKYVIFQKDFIVWMDFYLVYMIVLINYKNYQQIIIWDVIVVKVNIYKVLVFVE